MDPPKLLLLVLVVTLTPRSSAEATCPLEITPNRMVIQYQSQNQDPIKCEPESKDMSYVESVHWRYQGIKIKGRFLEYNISEDWDQIPTCFATFPRYGECQKQLNFTLYKTPDRVSIWTPNYPVVEDRGIQLYCDIINVAPAQNLQVRWYQGNQSLQSFRGDLLRLTGCHPDNTSSSSCDIGSTRSPLNVTSSILLSLNRTHDRQEFRCEARLDLGDGGPQPPPVRTSNPLNITVYYKPEINTTMLPKRVPVFSGYGEELVCEADGYPPPKIQWFFGPDKVPHVSGNKINVTEAGLYSCNASNVVDSISYRVEVVLKEDYLPLIAGFVAVTVCIISAIFVFIYSIYYKNTKMRRYSLKNAKLDNAQNGYVAHNGWDMQFPMTKLSS